jgi:hypothetical protein
MSATTTATRWIAGIAMAASLLAGGAAFASADDTGSPSNSNANNASDSPTSTGPGTGGVPQMTRNLHQANELDTPRTLGP